MAKFLNTTATSYYLEEIIKGARERLILISPYLRLNDRIKELLEDKNRLKIDVRIIYGKTDLQPAEADWLKELEFVRTSFCKNLHAKCYMSEESCIITSLNLYEFSQINNNEMGMYISRDDDPEIYRDAYAEAQRIIRISDEVKIAMDRVAGAPANKKEEPAAKSAPKEAPAAQQSAEDNQEAQGEEDYDNLTIARLASHLGAKTKEIKEALLSNGYMEVKDDKDYLTDKGRGVGGRFLKGRYGGYLVWPKEFDPRKG